MLRKFSKRKKNEEIRLDMYRKKISMGEYKLTEDIRSGEHMFQSGDQVWITLNS